MHSRILNIVIMIGFVAIGGDVNMEFAQNTWPSAITESNSVILIGRIRRVDGPHPAGNQQRGTAAIQVLQGITPSPWLGPTEITVAFAQFTSWQSRMREGNGGWNGVDVKPGVTLLMGLRGGSVDGNGSPASLEAVSQIASPSDSLVTA